jgi:hypothetical protein
LWSHIQKQQRRAKRSLDLLFGSAISVNQGYSSG